MRLSISELRELCDKAIVAAQKAGDYIAANANRTLEVQNKDQAKSLAAQVFTEVDIQAEKIITDELAPTISSFDLALLAEESPDDKSRFEKDYFWCIDPLDGTLSFLEGSPGYSVSIALIRKDGTPMIGVIYDPLEQTLYHAIHLQGFWKNHKAWPLIANKAKEFLFIIDRSFEKKALFPQTLAAFKEWIPTSSYSELKLIKHGGGALNAMWVLENQSAVYFKYPRQENSGGSLWDYAASACIFNEAKAFASDIYGQAIDLNRADSTYLNHRGILYASNKILQSHIIQLHQRLSQ